MASEFDKLMKTHRELNKVGDFQKNLSEFQKNLKAVELSRPSAFIDSIMKIQEQSPVFQLSAKLKPNDELARLLAGPAADLKRSGAFNQKTPLPTNLIDMKRIQDNYESRFVLLEKSKFFRSMENFKKSPVFAAIEPLQKQMSGIQQAMEKMKNPWMDASKALHSVRGFGEIQALGLGLKTMNSFGDGFTSMARSFLGDWRDPISWPEEIYTDLAARADLYDELGYDPALSAFPNAAFEESLQIAGLSESSPSFVDLYGEPVPDPLGQDEKLAATRTNAAHRRIAGFETHLRRFIDKQMSKHFGPDWPKSRLPNGMYERWVDKEKKAVKAGRQTLPLIARADFTEYVDIVCKGDNWREVFKPFFERPENFRESMQRLYPVRVDTMHSRFITQDDELLLCFEVRRILIILRESY